MPRNGVDPGPHRHSYTHTQPHRLRSDSPSDFTDSLCPFVVPAPPFRLDDLVAVRTFLHSAIQINKRGSPCHCHQAPLNVGSSASPTIVGGRRIRRRGVDIDPSRHIHRSPSRRE